MSIKNIMVLSIAIILAALVNGGIYVVAGSGKPYVWKVNKFTGTTILCIPQKIGCQEIEQGKNLFE